jgi:hypothetical protein
MAERQPEPTLDFKALEKKIREQSEQYRERYLSVKLYSTLDSSHLRESLSQPGHLSLPVLA